MPLDDGDENLGVVTEFYSGYTYGFGLAPFWRCWPPPFAGRASFECIRSETVENIHRRHEEKMDHTPGKAIHRELVAGNTRIFCWEFHFDQASIDKGMPFEWYVDCLTSIEEKHRAFQASYEGPKEALPVFYNILKNMKQAH
jgi:hypothetical protein